VTISIRSIICERVGANVTQVVKGTGLDSRIEDKLIIVMPP
jgi:UDP-glucose 6-dehydrogenase